MINPSPGPFPKSGRGEILFFMDFLRQIQAAARNTMLRGKQSNLSHIVMFFNLKFLSSAILRTNF